MFAIGDSVLGSLGKLDFGVSFWGLVGFWLGEVSTPMGGCLLFRRPVDLQERFFEKNRRVANDRKR